MARGRPREFCADEALERVLRVFWRAGFDGASVQDLADAAGVSKPSLYAAYGNKEALYLAALRRYSEKRAAEQTALLEAEPDGEVALRQYLRSTADDYTDPSHPTGCLVVIGTSGCESDTVPAGVRQALCEAVRSIGDVFERRLERARFEGQLPPGEDVRAMAAYFTTLLFGLSVQARSGAPRATLHAVVDGAMERWRRPGQAPPALQPSASRTAPETP